MIPCSKTVAQSHELTPKELVTEAIRVHKKYIEFFGPELIQGAEMLIAEEIASKLGAKIVSGVLHTADGDKAHYWCVKNNTVLDPIFYVIRANDARAWREETEGGERELKKYIERYRAYQI